MASPVHPTPPPSDPMQRALALAHQALWLTSPNPRVGCVLTDAQGQVLGEGHTQRAGGPHAEIVALQQARQRGGSVTGATAWVTLEPCAHQGRTGPCCDALAQAGVARVVVATGDPNPQVAGQGLARLRAAGVQVHLLDPQHPQAQAARELNLGFFSRMERGRPWVRLKVAASIDGQTALANGQSQWITSPEARRDGHAWRARACAVLTGIGTVREDDPLLTVREVDAPRQPHLAVVDSRLELPPTARLLSTRGQGHQARHIWVYTAVPEQPAQRQSLSDAGAQVIDLPGPGDKVDLAALMADLARREVNELHVEAGFKLNGSLMRAGLVDEWLVYLAPQWLGPGQGMAHLPALEALTQAQRLRFHAVDRVGPDLRVILRA